MAKRTLSIEMWENGSRTYLGEITIDKVFAEKLLTLDCDKPRRLKQALQFAVYNLWSFLTKHGI